jgi:hypothetical protein
VNAPVSFVDAQWAAIASLVTDGNAKILKAQLPRMIALVKPEVKLFSLCQESVLRIICQLATKLDDVRRQLVAMRFGEQLAAIVRTRRRHGILLSAVRQFLTDVIAIPNFGVPMFEPFFPVMCEFFKPDAPLEARAFAWSLHDVTKESGVFVELDAKLDDETSGRMRLLAEGAAKPYGGVVPEVTDGGVLQNMSQDQLLAVIRFMNAQVK